MFKNNWKVAFRRLVKNKIFFSINIAGLSVGLTSCILILLYVKDENSFDRFHKNSNHIYQLVCDRIEKDGVDTKSAIAALVQGQAFKEAIPEIQSFTRVYHKQTVVESSNQTFKEDICWADENFFSVFSFPLVEGDFQSLVMTVSTAKKYFGTSKAIGKTIRVEVDGQLKPFTVTGITKDPPENSSIQFGCMLPFAVYERANPDNGWMWFSFPTYFVLHPAANIPLVERKMEKVYQLQAASEISMNHEAGYDTKFKWSMLPFTQMHLNTDYQGIPAGSDPVYGYILSGIAGFILLIACINFINLSIGGAVKRAPEISYRKMLGASRKQLISQFMVESMLVSILSFLFAVTAAWVLLPLFNELTAKRLSLACLFDASLIGLLLLLYVLCFVGAGFYPALVLSGKKPLGKKNKNYLSKSLVVGQFSFAILLIIGMLFTNAQLQYMTHAASGYNEKNLLEFTVDKAVMNQELMDNCKTNFTLVSGVEKLGYANIGKFGGKTIAGGRAFAAVYERIDENYLDVLQTSLVRGRYFSAGFKADVNQSVLVNETFVQSAGWKDPVGRTIDYMNIPGMEDKKMYVVGVVKDYHFESLKEKIKPQVFCMLPQLPMGRFVVRLKTADQLATIKALGKVYHSLFPEHPFEYNFREDVLQKNYRSEARWKKIITCSAIVAIFIACIGLFGLALLNTEKRSREIAIRKVVGADLLQLLQLISFDFLQLVFIALSIAIPAGGYLSVKWLEQFAYRVQTSWWLFALAGFIATGMAIATIGFQVIKAALADPVKSLKNQ